jgi:Domain of unknown function (DUF4372)
MLQLFSRTEFERAIVEHRAERHARGFSCWGQFVAMLFCHLGRAQSLREICGGLAASEGKLRHLGLPDAPKRSTLAYANEHRPWQLYRNVFYQLLNRCREVAGTHGFRFKNKLLTLDATLIELCASSCSSIATCSPGSMNRSSLRRSTPAPSNWRFPGDGVVVSLQGGSPFQGKSHPDST